MKPEHKKYVLWAVVLLAIIGLAATVVYFGFFHGKKEEDTEVGSGSKRRPSETRVSGNHPAGTDNDDDWLAYIIERVKELKEQKDGLKILMGLVKEIINTMGDGINDFFGIGDGSVTPGSTSPGLTS